MPALTVPRAGWWLACAAALAALYAVVFAIVGSSLFTRAPDVIALAATFDLTLTAALVVWWFGVRRGAVRPWLLVVVVSWGVALARRHVPHAPLGALLAAGGALEALSVGWLLIRIRRVVRVAREAREAGPIDALEAGLGAARIPARVAAIFATELAVVWLAVTGWFRRPRGDGFAMTSSGWLLYAGVFGFLIAVETAALHIALAHWSPLAAWISTASSLYALVWLAGDAHAIRLYPVAIRGDALRVTVGIRWRARIPLADILSVTATRSVSPGAARPARDPTLNLALIEPTVVLALRAPIEVRGLLGRRRRGDRIALTIDDVPGFTRALANAGGDGAAPAPPRGAAR